MGYTNKSGILEWNKENIDAVIASCGVYVLRNSAREFIYIGKSETSIRDRLLVHWNSGDIQNVAFFDWYETADVQNASQLEGLWISKYKPIYNIQLK